MNEKKLKINIFCGWGSWGGSLFYSITII